jgi:hypothetical protein
MRYSRPGEQRLGQILRDMGVVNTDAIIEARLLQMKESSAKRIGEIMLELGHITENDLSRALAIQQEMA